MSKRKNKRMNMNKNNQTVEEFWENSKLTKDNRKINYFKLIKKLKNRILSFKFKILSTKIKIR
jgi:hypothetical protein